MKYATWMCLLAASASQIAIADEAYQAYRLGQYNHAAEPLIGKSTKDPLAAYYLGRLYLYGYGQLKNNELAMRYFTQAADQGYLPAVVLMAKFNLLHEKNSDEAIRWFKKAASMGDVNAQLFMAAASLFGFGVKKNIDVATHYTIDAAKNGSSMAQFALAENFLDSKHSSNNKLGLIWLTKAATAGNLKALTKLGKIYIDGKLVSKDMNKGLELLNKAAAQNYSPAFVELGNAALLSDNQQEAIAWYTKAAKQHNVDAYLSLAHLYLNEKSTVYNPKIGFQWVTKAAQEGSIAAKNELSDLYQKGVGVSANQELAKYWQDLAKKEDQDKISPLLQVARWLSNEATDKIEKTSYQMNGIFSAWTNATVLRNNNYNQAPQLEVISRHDIFKPKFVMIQPNAIPMDRYYDALITKSFKFQSNQWSYPSYHLNPQVESLEKIHSFVLAPSYLPTPYQDANYYTDEHLSPVSLLDQWTQGWQKQANYMAVFNQMYFRAILGDGQSQFEIGQMFQYGLGVKQDYDAAIVFYQNAAEQKHLGAEYNLGMLYLQHAKDANDYQTALNWLTDGAFKGNKKSQFVLAKLLEEGKIGPDGKEYIKPNHGQAISMLYLSAANNYGPAEYELAEYMSRENKNGLSVAVRQQQIALIRTLYQRAANNGVAEALLPLAFYNAIDTDKQRQANAFSVAQEQANSGVNHAALLLGLLYDRGIGVAVDHEKAMYWYEISGENPVSEFILGTYITEGNGVSADQEKGLEQLNRSAEAKFSYAYFNRAVIKEQARNDFLSDLNTAYQLGNSHAGIVLADYYLAEHNDAIQMNQAKEIYTVLAEKGDQYAQLKLGFMMEKGLGTAPDLAGAQHWYTAAADQGNTDAQYLLGQLYQVGMLGEPDYNLAKYWYQKAAKKLSKASVALGFIEETVDDNYANAFKYYHEASAKGDVIGDYNLALMYEYGKGMPVNYENAKNLFLKAANQGVDKAMTQLGNMALYGLGQERNVQQGLSWYQKAANLGNGNALYVLGLLAETGVDTKPDFQSALNYYQKASAKGNEKAMLALARMYHYGLGVEKDSKKSASIYQKLAEKQNAYAQYQLGTYYLEGIGGERSAEKGRQLLEQSRENGNVEAGKLLQKLDVQTQAHM